MKTDLPADFQWWTSEDLFASVLAAPDRIQDKEKDSAFCYTGTSSISTVSPSAYVVDDSCVACQGRNSTGVEADHPALIEAQQADPMCQTIKELMEGRPVPDFGFKP